MLFRSAYPSADGALTALTASFCIDFLGFEENKNLSEERKTKLRKIVHIGFSVLLLLVIVIFRAINDEAVIRQLFKVANYTYGPLLGLFFFGILTKKKVNDQLVPFICLLAPTLCYILDANSKEWFSGYLFGNELLLVNGLLTFAGLWAIKKSSANPLIS